MGGALPRTLFFISVCKFMLENRTDASTIIEIDADRTLISIVCPL